jgi:subtilisin family serine protease
VRSVRSTNYDYPSQTWTNIEVYVLDTGIRRSHTEFQNRAVWGTDSISRSPHRTDRQGHGTHVAGTIGGRLFGVAKGVRMIDVRVLGDDGGGTMSSIIGGINWVANRQRGLRRTGIANLSLGGPFSLANNRAVDAATAAGVLMVTASGNENQNGCNVSPGSASTALNVNAADINDNPARFSNWGTCTHIYAPGVDIRSAGHRGDTAVATMSGTSMAAPHMAGVAAKILAENPRQSVQQLRAAVFQRATRNAMRRVDRNTPNVYLRHTC